MRCAFQISLLFYLVISIRLFSEQNFDFEVPEDIPEGTLIGKVALEPNLSYRLNGHNQFASVNIQTGEVRISAPLNREAITPNGTIILILTAEPTTIIAVRINVLDINDNSPTFPSKYMNVSIVESAVIGSRIRLQPANDPDLAENGTIVNYELKNGEEFFTLIRSSNSTGGDVLLLELLAKLDRETRDLFILNISAYDGGNPPRSGYCIVYVSVLDANDNPPTFRQPRYDIQLNGSVLSDATVLRVEATDADAGNNGRISYYLRTNPFEYFQIDHDTGDITIQYAALNCSEGGCLQDCSGMCVLTVEAEDQGEPKLIGRTLVYIHLTNTNLHDPEINFRIYPTDSEFASISSETAVGSTIAVITASDRDDGQNVRISIVGGNEENYFRLEGGENYGILRQNRIVDKRVEQFLLKFFATDDGVPPRSSERDLKVFVMKLNDTAPILEEKFIKVDIFETSPVGSFVTVVRASAKEDLHFSIIEDDKKNDDLFLVDKNTGIITLSKAWPNHTKWNYDFEIMVRKAVPSDKYSICTIQIAIIDVNDHDPQFSSPFYEVEVLEDIPPLTVIFKVFAADEDHGNNSAISYSIEGSPKEEIFIVKEFSGEILLRTKLDRETKKQHKITVTATDHGSPSRSSSTLLIINVLDVNDNDPYFAQLEYHGYIVHRDLPGTHLVQLEAFDDDSPKFAQISYLFYYSTPNFLKLDHATGRIHLAVHADLLNFKRKMEIVVGAKDNGGRSSRNNATVYIWLLDSKLQVPKFNTANNWSIEISENSSPEKILASFSVYPSIENIRYRINTTDLLINEITGEVRARRSFDREIEPRIGFTVYADGEWSTAMHQGTLTILDQNDNSPIFELDGKAQFVIDTRWIGIGAELFRLRCHDPDDGPNGHITYSINSTFFGIDSETGIVRLIKFPNGLNQLQFHVTATDNGEQSRHSTMKIVVEIKEDETIYSFPPVIALSIAENIPLGTIITNLAPKNITQRFEFQTFGVAGNYPIQIFPSGEVFVISKIDYEIMNCISISVAAFNSDKNLIPNKHEFLLQLYIEDINDNAPQCPKNNKFIILENNIPGAIVGLFNGIDNDSGPNGTLFYELLDNSKKIFSIDRYSGIIRALLVLDFELAQFYNLTVIVTDEGLLKTTCAIMVEVQDSNDNIPYWEQEFYHFYVSPSAENSFVGRVLARDLDSALNGEVRYKLQQKWMPFKINESTGDITQNGHLSPNHVYNITIIATDKGIQPLSNVTFVFIHSDIEKDCTPNFTSYPNTDIKIDDSLLGQMITQIHAVACGAEVLYSLSYGHSTHSNLGLFWINSADGSIFLTKRLDAYVGQRIELIIKAKTTLTSNSATFGIAVVDRKNGNFGTDTITIHIQENNSVGKICGKIETLRRDLQLLRQIPSGTTFRLQEQNLICDELLDREQINFYRLVIAERHGLKSRIISVQVDDENDNSPECFGTKAVLVRSESLFVSWNCSDKDAGLNGTIGYEVIRSTEIVSKVNDTGFTVNPFTGDPKYFSVLVYDRNTKSGFREDDELRKTTELHYILIPINPRLEAPIEFKKQYRFDRDIQLGTVFGTVVAKTGAVVEYFTTSFKNELYMNSVQWADIDRRTGQLRINQKPDDHLVNMEITLLSEGFTKTITIELLVTDEKSSIDKFRSYYEFTIEEGMSVGSTVGRIGNGETFKFELLKKNDNFEIEEESGVIRIKNEVGISETYLDIRITNQDYNEISKQITVLIIVIRAYNNALFCLQGRLDLMVPENSPSGTFVGILTSGDHNLTRYTLRGHPDTISIDNNTGIISTTAPFDFEKENLYQFKAIAHGIQSTSMECYVFLHIIDKNDNAPKFGSSSYEVKVYENAPIGQVILQLDVDDLDTVNQFVYEISVIGNERNWFGIKPDGRIFLIASLDREYMAIHRLHITVYDQRQPERAFNATTTVKVIVLDINDNAPRFLSPSSFFIFGGISSGTIIGLVHAIDPDLGHNGQLQYRILPWSNPDGLFMINPVLGYLQVHDQINAKQQKEYHLLIEAKDYGISKRLSSIVAITVTVIANDKESSRLRNFYHAKIPENVPVGHTVVQIITDMKTNVLFEIESGNEDRYFQISPTNGTITTNERLDAARNSIYNLTVSMRSNNNTKKQRSIILIEILNIGVKTTQCSGRVDRILYVGENMQGPYPVTIGALKSTTADSGMNGMLSYSLVQGNSTLFRVVPQTGKLQVTEPLNYEMQNRYELVVQANDLTVPRRYSATSTVTVVVLDVNDNIPLFEQPQYYIEVMENEPVEENLTLLCLKATDKDGREFSMIRYSLDDADLLPFFINSTTGCLGRLKVLDREFQSQWILKVVAHDNGKFVEHSSSAVVRIRVLDQNDNVPVILNEKLDVFIPNNVKKDDVVYVLSAYDLDEDDTLYYSLNGPDLSYFQIDQSGIITATRQLLKQDYSITATVSDHGNLNSSVGLGFYVSEAMRFPIFEKRPQREFMVTEHDPNMLVTKFIAQSVNVSNRGILYSIFGGDPYHHFYLNPNSGELYTTNQVDYEYRKQYVLWIAAIDQHAQPMVSYANCVVNVVDINDNKPFFEKAFYSSSLVENGDSDELIIKVIARDYDSGMNGKISYSLMTDGSDAWKYFKINEESGEIFTVSGLDAEHLREYHLHVIAKDHGIPQLLETVVVKIEVLDENDNSPRFSNLFYGSVAENSPLGTLILQVTSYDADVNSTLVYGLEGNYADSFLIDQQTGWISLAKEVDREKRNEYSIKVKAWDGLWEVRTSLTITIQDVNDNAPTFSDPFYKFSIASDSKIFTEIGQILAFDADEGLNGQIRYDLRCGNDLFMVEPLSGHIFSIITLEQYVNNTVECKGFASDQGFPPMNSNATVFIYIIDSAENNKTKQPYYEFALLLDVDPGTAIGHLPLHGKIAVVNDSRFTIDQDGHLFTNATFSEAILGHKIIFSVAMDDKNNPMKAIVSIEFTEPNIYRPQFSSKRYKFSIQENSPLYVPVGAVMAKDPDIGLNGHVTYHIIHDIDYLPFAVEPTTGTILTTGNVDFEETSNYHFLITATDSGFSALRDTAEVTIEVIDENDNVPEFTNRYVQYMIAANSPVGTTIAHLSAVDMDSDSNALIVYHLFSDSAEELPFAINATFGTLYVSSELHYETTNEYLLHVLASNPKTSNPEGLIPENSRNMTHFDVLQVEIFVKPDDESELYFPETERNFEISASALKGTIIGKVEAIYQSGNYYNKILYRMASNDLVDINDRTGEIYVKKTWNGTIGTLMVQIVATSQLWRNANFKPNVCKVYIELKDTEALPILQSHYKFSLSEDADSSKSFIIFEQLPRKCRLDIVEEEIGYDIEQPFCIDEPGKLRLCGPVNYEQKAEYRLQIALLENDIIRSRALVTITVNNVNDNGPSLDPAFSVGYILENSPINTIIMKLHMMDSNISGKQPTFKYQIADRNLSQIFAINDTTGIISSSEVLDREKRSLYIVPITVSDLVIHSRQTTVHLRIHIDDQDDNAPETGPRTINLGYLYEIPDMIMLHAFPVDADQVGVYNCWLSNASQAYNMSSNCILNLPTNLLETEYFLNAPLLVKTSSRHTNVTFPINLRMRRDASPRSLLNDFGVIVELWGVERSIADSISAFEEIFPDMALQILGLQQLEVDFFRIFVAVLNHDLVPTSKDNALKLLKQFFAEKLFSKNVHLKQLALDMCTITSERCMHGTKCSQNITKNGELLELMGYKTSFIVPIVISQVNCLCENDMPCNGDENQTCDENAKCQNGGTCEPHRGICLCPKGYTGKFCENDIDECEDKNICGNGKCLNIFGSFVCACDGNDANSPTRCNNSNSNICDNCHRGICVKKNNGKHLCECNDGYSGRYCQLKIRCFNGFSSSLQFPLHQQIFMLTQGFRTFSPSNLLLSSFAIAGFKGPHFTLTLQNGQVHLSGDLSQNKTNELLVEEKVNDGKWKMIRFRYKHRRVKLTVEHCDNDGFCKPCKSTRCIAVANNFDISTTAGGQVVYIGGVKNPVNSAIISKQSGTTNFEGCMRQIVINEHESDKILGFLEQNIIDKDSWKTCADDGDIDMCSGGICVIDENDRKCICIDGFDALNCHKAMEPWHVKSGGILFQLSMYMMQKIELAKRNTSMQISSRRHGRSITDDKKEQLREIPCEESEIEGDILDDIPAQWMELDFKTALKNTVIFAIVEEMRFSKIELINGSAQMITKMRGAQPIEVHIANDLDDTEWHRLSIQISEDQKLFRVEIDGHGKEIRSEEQLPTLISSSLLSLSLGHDTVDYATAFSGCFRRFIVNNQAQNFDALEGNLLSQQIFKSVAQKGARKGCDQFLMKRVSLSLEWKIFWALIGIICTSFFISIFAIVLRFVRKHLFIDGIVEKRRKCWKPKLSRLLSVMKSDSRTTHIHDNNDVTIQRAVYCGPDVLQNNKNEVYPCDSHNSFQPQNPWINDVHDLDASTLHSTSSRDSIIYQNLKLLEYNQQRSRRIQATKEENQEKHCLSQSNDYNDTIYEKPFAYRPLHLLNTSNLQSLSTDTAEKDSSDSETDSATVPPTPYSLVKFRPFRTVFADSEDSSADGSLNASRNLHKLAQFPNFL